jgi:hypothetical protein
MDSRLRGMTENIGVGDGFAVPEKGCAPFGAQKGCAPFDAQKGCAPFDAQKGCAPFDAQP